MKGHDQKTPKGSKIPLKGRGYDNIINMKIIKKRSKLVILFCLLIFIRF